MMRRMKHPSKKQANERRVRTPGLQPECFKVHKRLRACLKIRKDAVSVAKPGDGAFALGLCCRRRCSPLRGCADNSALPKA